MSFSIGHVARLWRCVHLRRTSLVRPWDRLEAAILLGVLAGMLLTPLLGVVVGSATYASERAVAQHSHRATATLLEDGPQRMDAPDTALFGSNSTERIARWTDNTGVERTGNVTATFGDRPGQEIPIWINDAGEPVSNPPTPFQATLTASLGGIHASLATAVLLAAGYRIARRVLDRQRAAAWEREWLLISGEDPGYSRT